MTKEAKQLLKELDDFCVVSSPDYTEKFTALCKKMAESGLVDAEFLSEAFQSVFNRANTDGYNDGYTEGYSDGCSDSSL